MEGLRRATTMAALVALMCAVVVNVPEVSATRWMVGGGKGWSPNVNYTIWAQDINFYNGDWLFFVYDRNQQNILEVNKTDYEACNSDHPLHNWTRGAGRDVVPLNVTRNYYFLSGKGFCFSGMKLAIKVENPPPPPTSAPLKEKSAAVAAAKPTFTGRYVVPAVIAVGAAWDVFLRFL